MLQVYPTKDTSMISYSNSGVTVGHDFHTHF